jgi:hypothetical protein
MSSEHEKMFKAHGVHYSKLWCLSYWDPSWQLIINPMHCILEGLVPYHTHSLLGLTSQSNTSTLTSTQPAFLHDFGEVPAGTMSSKEMTQISTIHTLLVSQIISHNGQLDKCFNALKNLLLHKSVGLLKFVCNILGCTPQKAGRTYQVDYVKALLEWVSTSFTMFIILSF